MGVLIASLRQHLLALLRRPSAIVSSATLPRPAIVAPDTGGFQFIDMTGAITSPASATIARAFASLVITASGGGVLSVVGSLTDGLGVGTQGIVNVFLDDATGAAGVLTPAASVGTILPPAVIAVTRLTFQILTNASGAFAYTATGTGAAGACTQVHASVNALDQQAVAIV